MNQRGKGRTKRLWDGTQVKVEGASDLGISKWGDNGLRKPDYDAPHIDGLDCWCGADLAECDECFGLGCMYCEFEGEIVVHKT